MPDPLDLDLSGAAGALEDGELSSRALTLACLDRIDRTAELGAFITVDRPGALEAAEAADGRRRRGAPRSWIDGVPIALKDLIAVRGLPTTAASKLLESFVPPYDATVTTRVKDAGLVILGKTNLDEFAMGSSGEHSAFGPVRNPWDPSRSPGGSSGGSAVAVASRQAFAALGTDTGGSVRQPAAMCGVFGLKPTYGRVSRSGVVAFASSLDQVGPIARSSRDLALLLGVVAGPDPRDATSSERPVPDYGATLSDDLSSLTIGLPDEYFETGVKPEVAEAVRAGVRVLEQAKVAVRAVRLPHTRSALAAYYIICAAEASSNLARYDGIRYGRRAEAEGLTEVYVRSRTEGFGPEVTRRVLLGTFVLSAGYVDAYYERAQRVRTLVRRDFERAFDEVDLLVTPTSPTAAFALGSRLDNPVDMYGSDVCTLAANLAGLPAVSVPAGFTSEGLPIGMQMIAPPFEEGRLLAAAHAHERRTDHHLRRP